MSHLEPSSTSGHRPFFSPHPNTEQGPDGGYHIFAGREASRSFVTGCFDTRTDSQCLREAQKGLDGFNDDQMAEVDQWLAFFLNHETYSHVGFLDSFQ